MKTVRPAAEHLKTLEVYDPKYLPARIYLNANENPYGISAQAREQFTSALSKAPLHRYPDPLATRLRSAIASGLGVPDTCVVLGNGGDELLFNVCLAYGGKGRTLLSAPPTFSVYGTNALLTHTELVEIPRASNTSAEGTLDASSRSVENTLGDASKNAEGTLDASSRSVEGVLAVSNTSAEGTLDFSVDEQAILARLRMGNIDIVILTSPNNPTGDCLRLSFIEEVLAATDAVVLIDHAYIEFAHPGYDATALLKSHANLAILRTFSKAYGLAGLRVGYLVGSEEITRELCKVRQPYSVDAFAALAALAVLEDEDAVRLNVARIITERERLFAALGSLNLELGFQDSGLTVAPSEANYLLFRVRYAHQIWQQLYDSYGILVRDLSQVPGLEDCLRVSIGTPEENDEFLLGLRTLLAKHTEY